MRRWVKRRDRASSIQFRPPSSYGSCLSLTLTRNFHCRASRWRATYRMLAATGFANTFQRIAVLDRERISMHRSLGPRAHFKAVGWCPPDCWGGVNKQKWRKNFQSMIYTHVCRPNTCPYRLGSRRRCDFSIRLLRCRDFGGSKATRPAETKVLKCQFATARGRFVHA